MADVLDNKQLYEQHGMWDAHSYQDAHYLRKVALVRGMIPDDVDTILDVGCGNGAILNQLPQDRWTVGGDRSWTALVKSKQRCVQISAENLPFQARSFSMVMCHQILEHLPHEILMGAVKEMARVADRYLMVSVPYRERIAQERARCADCGVVYNVWGHVRSFPSIEHVRCLFPNFSLRVHAFCGRENEYYSSLGLWCVQRLGGYWTTNHDALCPACGSPKQFVSKFPRRAVASIASRVERAVPKGRSFYWLLTLFERTV